MPGSWDDEEMDFLEETNILWIFIIFKKKKRRLFKYQIFVVIICKHYYKSKRI